MIASPLPECPTFFRPADEIDELAAGARMEALTQKLDRPEKSGGLTTAEAIEYLIFAAGFSESIGFSYHLDEHDSGEMEGDPDFAVDVVLESIPTGHKLGVDCLEKREFRYRYPGFEPGFYLAIPEAEVLKTNPHERWKLWTANDLKEEG